jgi:hypothetical protein
MRHRTRMIQCAVCGHRYRVTRVAAVDGDATIEEPAITGRAYCPNCGAPARWMHPADEPREADAEPESPDSG